MKRQRGFGQETLPHQKHSPSGHVSSTWGGGTTSMGGGTAMKKYSTEQIVTAIGGHAALQN